MIVTSYCLEFRNRPSYISRPSYVSMRARRDQSRSVTKADRAAAASQRNKDDRIQSLYGTVFQLHPRRFRAFHTLSGRITSAGERLSRAEQPNSPACAELRFRAADRRPDTAEA